MEYAERIELYKEFKENVRKSKQIDIELDKLVKEFHGNCRKRK